MDNSPVGGGSGKEKLRLESFLRKFSASTYFSLLGKHVVELVINLRHAVKPKTIFYLAVMVAILALFGKNLKDILFVSALALAASYSTIYKRTIRVPSAVELVTLGTVVTGVAYGPAVGALFGVVTTIASEIISSGVDVNTLFYAVARGLAGGFAQMMVAGFGWSILAAGMVSLIIFHVVSDFIYVVSGGIEAVPKILYYVVVNTLFNLLVFAFLGNPLLALARF